MICTRTCFVAFALFAVSAWGATPVFAQTSELTSADRLAMLYTSQLAFDDSSEPIVKVGIADGLETVVFEPSGPITVLPSGVNGPELVLPGKREYAITISDGKPGKYQYFVVLERMHPDETAALDNAQKRWLSAGVEYEILDVGSLFAISGTMFDNRETLVVTRPMEREKDARKALAQLEKSSGVALAIHSELAEFPTATLTLSGAGDGITFKHTDILWIDLGAHPAIVRNVPAEKGGLEDRSYAESLVLSPDRNGALSLVNGVRVETVLRGVVPAEIYSTAPLEALKAQAIAARGTLISQIGVRHLADPFNLCDEQHCQVFGGMGASRESTDNAVKETKGQILFHGKRIAETYYSSNSGGLSGSAKAVWNLEGREYLVPRYDDAEGKARTAPPTEDELRAFLTSSPESFSNYADASSGRHFRWNKSISPSDINAFVAKRFDIGAVNDMVVRERGLGGRVVQLEIVGETGTAVIERELPVRRLFGGLKSGLFVLDVERDAEGRPTEFRFTGGGFGHGVGMDQTGAMGMAAQGFDVGQILAHYYSGTVIKELW